MKNKLLLTIITGISLIILCTLTALFILNPLLSGGHKENGDTVAVNTPSPFTDFPDDGFTASPDEIFTAKPAEYTSAPASGPVCTETPAPETEPATAPATESAVPASTPEPEPLPTPVPTPEPAPETEPGAAAIVFTESKELHLPNLSEDLQFGQLFNLRGTVISQKPLKWVKVKITSENGNDPICPFTGRVNFADGASVCRYALEDRESPIEGKSINDIVPFKKLSEGRHRFILTASDGKTEAVIACTEFNVVKSEWLKLISNNFRDNFSQALKFFGSRERFMFRYKWGGGRNIITDPAWVKQYITSFKDFNGKWWTVHIDAVPHFQSALNYMDTTYLRVHGGNRDSGIIKLSKLIKSYNGTYVSRFVSDKTFISHHSFGTAVDINAGTKPFNNSTGNWNVIKTETKHLSYNGIKEYNGVKYYDFTYNGNWKEYYNGVPESLLNYLLYELAFYRAGFSWGYYYPHTCDGMHFTLTDLDKSLHENPGTGLRKVFSYCS